MDPLIPWEKHVFFTGNQGIRIQSIISARPVPSGVYISRISYQVNVDPLAPWETTGLFPEGQGINISHMSFEIIADPLIPLEKDVCFPRRSGDPHFPHFFEIMEDPFVPREKDGELGDPL